MNTSTIQKADEKQAVSERVYMMFLALYLGMVNSKDQILRSVEARREADRERGSHTTDVLLWALAIIIIVGIAVAALTTYVTRKGNELTGQP